jgi:bifunctional non-homologous end joining protein LigD
MPHEELPSVELRFKEGASDKVYRASIETSGIGFVVNFAYGRWGSALNAGSKTVSPVTLDEATGIYDKLVRSKTAKGYKPLDGHSGGTGMEAVQSGQREDTGLRAQLLNPVDDTPESVDAYLTQNRWCAQEKFDGRRMVIERNPDGMLLAANRNGLRTALPEALARELQAITTVFVLDGEIVGEHFYAFDLLTFGLLDLRSSPYAERMAVLAGEFSNAASHLSVADTACGTVDKRRMLERLRIEGREGMVFKDIRAHWSAGRPASGGSAIKVKFWSSCSCLVKAVNGNRRSVALTLLEREIGNVTIPPNHKIPEPGQIVEVRYLYVIGQKGNLYQPVYLGPRYDVGIEDCTAERQRIKYKAA